MFVYLTCEIEKNICPAVYCRIYNNKISDLCISKQYSVITLIMVAIHIYIFVKLFLFVIINICFLVLVHFASIVQAYFFKRLLFVYREHKKKNAYIHYVGRYE